MRSSRTTQAPPALAPRKRCAIYTRQSTDEGLDQDYNSLEAQRDAGLAFVSSQRHEGWSAVPDSYDDGGFSGGNLDRPALKRLMADIEDGRVDIVVVYKIDRLTRSLPDFAKLVDVFDRNGVSFVSVTQQFNTTTSMGRLTLNILLSFAQFEREVTGERIRDKIAASKAKGMWMGGMPPLGYDVVERKLLINAPEADLVRYIFRRYSEHGSAAEIVRELAIEGRTTKAWQTQNGQFRAGRPIDQQYLFTMLRNRIYLGEIQHKGKGYQREQVVQITGADQADYNGQFRVISTTTTTFTFAVSGTPVSPATTTTSLTAKVAPLGWEKPFSGTNKAAYRSKNPQSPQNLLLIDNSLKTPNYTTSWAKWANVGIVEDLSDIDTIVGAQAPYDPNNPTQNWKQVTGSQWGWHKWYHARGGAYENSGDSGSGARNWVLIGDDRLFFLFCTNAPSYNWYGRNFYCFGDIISFKAGDNYGTVLGADDNFSGMSSYWSYPGQNSGYGLIFSLDFTGKVLLRNHTQLGNPVRFGLTSLNTNNGQQVCGRGPTPFPNGADYSLWLLPTYVRQEDGHMRGIMPGMLWMPQDRPYSDQTIVDNVVGQAGKKFLLVRTQYSSETEGAQIAFDITGPWR